MTSVRRRKCVLVFDVGGSRLTATDWTDQRFLVVSGQITDYGDRADVRLFGPAAGDKGKQSSRFRLHGPAAYKPAPAWVIDLCRRAGYSGPVNAPAT